MPVVLRCLSCSAERRFSDQQSLELLQSNGMLRRETKPDAALLRELLLSVVGNVCCEECGHLGVSVQDDWGDDWSDEVLCEGCKTQIDPERLEVFPDTKFCPKCQSSAEAGGSPGAEVEYCMRCAGVMKLQKRGGSGVAGYQMVCRDCGKKA